jgi:hypothetical protein
LRLERALHNYLETFPLLAAAVLVAHVAGRHDWMTEWGVQLYFWGRIAYVALYAGGIFLVRSLVLNVATAGIVPCPGTGLNHDTCAYRISAAALADRHPPARRVLPAAIRTGTRSDRATAPLGSAFFTVIVLAVALACYAWGGIAP